jgi:hypothetical protein
MALTIPHSFTNSTVAEAAEVNSNFSAVKIFVDAIQDGSGISSSAIVESKIATSAVSTDKIASNSITEVKIADNAVTQAKLADRAVGSAELKEITLIQSAATAYTPVLSDAQKLITFSAGTPIGFTIPTDASVLFQIGDQINILQLGAGQITISAVTPGTTTVVSQGSKFKTNGQYAMATIVKVAANTWVVLGNLAV